MKPKISIPHVALTVFCFAGLHILLHISLATIGHILGINLEMSMSYTAFAAIGFCSALLSTTFSRGSKIVDISVAAICIALLQTGISLGAYQIQSLSSSLQPISTSVSLSAICIAGALLGARIANQWHTLVASDNILVNILVVLLTVFGSMYLVYFSGYSVVLVSESLVPLTILTTLIVCPMITGYVAQACTRERVETYFLFALFAILSPVWLLVSLNFGLRSAIYMIIPGLVLVLLYYSLAKVGIRLARKHAQTNKPDIPSAKATSL